MWLNEEARIANINQLPETDGFTSPPEGWDDEHLLILEIRAECTQRRKKPVPIVGLHLEPATFRLQAST